MILGENEYRPTLMNILRLRRRDVGRFRDVYCKEDGTSIYVFTRNSHVDWCQSINQMLRERPDFLSSWKDSYDNTFMTFEFKTPPEFVDRVKWIADQTDNRPPMERFMAILDDLGSGKDTPQVSRAKSVVEKIAETIQSTLKEGGKRKVTNESGGIDIYRFDDGDQGPGEAPGGKDRD